MKRILSIALCSGLLSGCLSDYAVTLNEKVMYTPPPLFSAFKLADVALDTCVRQHINDKQIRAAADLKRLNCSHAGIKSLEGIGLFDKLELIKLDDNHITELKPLLGLPRLKEISLANNQLSSVAALKALSELEQLNLAGNFRLACGELKSWPNIQITAPTHCK